MRAGKVWGCGFRIRIRAGSRASPNPSLWLEKDARHATIDRRKVCFKALFDCGKVKIEVVKIRLR